TGYAAHLALPSFPTRRSSDLAPLASREPAWTRRDALASLPFWSVSAPFALALIAQVAFIVHQIAFMEPIVGRAQAAASLSVMTRSEEHTSELQSRRDLVCRLL